MKTLFLPTRVCDETFSMQDVCDRLDGSLNRVSAILNGDIQEAKSWLLKMGDVMVENAQLRQEIRRLEARIQSLES